MPIIRSRWYSGERMRAELIQESERPEAPLAGGPSVTRVAPTPRRARCTAVETPKIPPPITTTRETGVEDAMTTLSLTKRRQIARLLRSKNETVPRDDSPHSISDRKRFNRGLCGLSKIASGEP